MNEKIFLASSSPRRIELLNQIGIVHTPIKTNVDETFPEGMKPEQAVSTLAFKKARSISKNIDGIIIGADTIVSYNGEFLGKPKTELMNYSMLKKLSGNVHEVWTGLAVIKGNRQICASTKTEVEFRYISDEEIEEYIATKEGIDKAGGYAVQGIAAKFVKRIDGEYTNVVGMPLCMLSEILNKLMEK